MATGGPVVHGNLFSSVSDRDGFHESVQGDIEWLLSQGFVATETPNLFTKDGVGLTLEAVRHGRDKAMVRHAQSAEARNAKPN